MTWHISGKALREFIERDDGQDLMEYGLLMALIAVAAIAGVTKIGDTINTVFWEVIAAHH